MIAMQYTFVLPSDYSMEQIENRIKNKGHLLNGYPGLVFKAYLYARKDAKNYHSPVNSYAPFYVWENHHSMMSFLNSDGFKALCEQFGQPSVKTWFIESAPVEPTSQHHFACMQPTGAQTIDVCGINYHSWQALKLKWISDSELNEYQNTPLYALGYIAHGLTSSH